MSEPPATRGPTRPQETERVRRIFKKQASKYDRSMGRWEKILFPGNREWACSRATGDVLEIAFGTGRNLPYYPATVRLTAIELSPEMVDIGRTRANELGREVDLRVGDAQALDLPDETFDTVLCTYGLCTIPDHGTAVREAARVLRPGGKLILAEHVRSPNPVVRAGQRLLEPLTIRFGGDHLTREPLDELPQARLTVEQVTRSKLGIVELLTARKAA